MTHIYSGDCRSVLQSLAEESIDLVVTSPPYDSLRDYNGSLDWDFAVFQTVARELTRVLVAGGVIVWIVADSVVDGSETGSSFRQALFFRELGLNIHDTMIWEKDGIGLPNPTRYSSCFEYMFIFSKGKPKTANLIADRPNKMAGYTRKARTCVRNSDGTMGFRKPFKPYPAFSRRRNVWHAQTEKNSRFVGHPAMAPLALVTDHILSWSNPGDTVLDPFAGSGTTLLAAKNTGRQYVGIEKDEAYFRIIQARLASKEAA